MGRRRTSALALIALAMLPVACGGDDDEDATSNESTEDSSGGDAGGAAAGEQSLTFGIGGEMRSLDVLIVSDGVRDMFTMNVNETLTRLGPDGDFVPLLATDWTADGNTWTFNLREGVTFHDGSELTSEDVVASFDRGLSPEGEVLPSVLSAVTDVAAVDDHTVTITTENPDPTIPAGVSLVTIVPAEWADPADTRMTGEMMGTGPYRFVEWRRGRDIAFERFDGYWGDEPQIDAFTVRFMPDEAARLAALEADEIDVAYNMPADQADRAPKVIAGDIAEMYYMRLNSLAGPLTDVDLRRASVLAIDREAICEELFAGYCNPAHGQVILPEAFGFNPDLEDYPYDPDEARRIIEGNGGAPIAIDLVGPVGRYPKDRELGQAIEQMLEDVGFDVNGQYLEVGQWAEDYLEIEESPETAAPFNLAAHNNEVFDSAFSLTIVAQCGSPTAAYCDPAIDERVAAARSLLDDDAREAEYQAIWAELYDAYVFNPILAQQQVHLVQENVQWEPLPVNFTFVSEIELT